MKVELVKYPTDADWILCKRVALATVGKDSDTFPTLSWKKSILEARHSPIRTLNYAFRLEKIPYFASVHLCRHVHAIPFVESQRTDRTGEDRNLKTQNYPVNMWFFVNAEELMIVANKRLCGKADKVTREIVQMMCEEACKKTPEIKEFLVPMCKYHGGKCHEIYPCGKAGEKY